MIFRATILLSMHGRFNEIIDSSILILDPRPTRTTKQNSFFMNRQDKSKQRKCIMDSSLKSMLQCLGIAEDDQANLLNHHQIIDYQSLKDKHNDLKNQSLVNFPLEQQLNGR
jgi:ABC-type sulfate transport system substrate-binding protein